MSTKNWLLGGAAAVVVAGGLIAGLVSIATARPVSTAAASAGTSSSPQARPSGGSRDGGTVGSRDRGTVVTGDEATKVSAAVTAKDSSVTVSSVRKNADGSYVVLGTKAGQNVVYRVSADLATVTQAQGGRFGASGGADDNSRDR